MLFIYLFIKMFDHKCINVLIFKTIIINIINDKWINNKIRVTISSII